MSEQVEHSRQWVVGQRTGAENVERVRSYLEQNIGCKKKEVICALDLHPRTVQRAIKIIRGQK